MAQGGFFDGPLSEGQREEMQKQSSNYSRAISASKQATEQKEAARRGMFSRGFFKGMGMGVMANMATQAKRNQIESNNYRKVDFNPTKEDGKEKDDGYSM